MEEHYNSLQEEAEAKTRKLKKLWTKYKGAQAEIADMQAEFQREKEDILDTIRELSVAAMGFEPQGGLRKRGAPPHPRHSPLSGCCRRRSAS